MKTSRRTFPPSPTHKGFSLEVPDGFVGAPFTRGDEKRSALTRAEPLALLASADGQMLLCVATRAAYRAGSVEDWARDLCKHFKLTITGCVSGFAGGSTHQHPCMFVEAQQATEGEARTVRIAMVEDGGRLFTTHASCPTQLWDACGKALEFAVASLELADPIGPTVSCVPKGPIPIHDMYGITVGEWPLGRDSVQIDEAALERGRAAAIERARRLVKKGLFDEAEKLLGDVDPYFHPGVALSRLFEEHLRELATSGIAGKQPALARDVFDRAYSWACRSYPDPHTQIEADDYEKGQAMDRAKLVVILGYDPKES